MFSRCLTRAVEVAAARSQAAFRSSSSAIGPAMRSTGLVPASSEMITGLARATSAFACKGLSARGGSFAALSMESRSISTAASGIISETSSDSVAATGDAVPGLLADGESCLYIFCQKPYIFWINCLRIFTLITSMCIYQSNTNITCRRGGCGSYLTFGVTILCTTLSAGSKPVASFPLSLFPSFIYMCTRFFHCFFIFRGHLLSAKGAVANGAMNNSPSGHI